MTFDNDDGTSRQEILKDIKRRRPPFDEDLCLCLEEYDYEGRPAYYVKVNGVHHRCHPLVPVPFCHRKP